MRIVHTMPTYVSTYVYVSIRETAKRKSLSSLDGSKIRNHPLPDTMVNDDRPLFMLVGKPNLKVSAFSGPSKNPKNPILALRTSSKAQSRKMSLNNYANQSCLDTKSKNAFEYRLFPLPFRFTAFYNDYKLWL